MSLRAPRYLRIDSAFQVFQRKYKEVFQTISSSQAGTYLLGSTKGNSNSLSKFQVSVVHMQASTGDTETR